jgi:eukaryotic-like serine/threonine-protein kinase
MDYCFQCGVITAPDDLFCGNCGISLLVPPTGSKSKDGTKAVESSAKPLPPQEVKGQDLGTSGGQAVNSSSSSASFNQDIAQNREDLPSVQPSLMVELERADNRAVSAEILEASTEQKNLGQKSDEIVSSNIQSNESLSASAPSQSGSQVGSLNIETDLADPALSSMLESQKGVSTANSQALDATITGSSPFGVIPPPVKATPPSTTASVSGRRQSTPKLLEAGIVLNGRYEIVRRIGGGGMGAVYLAKDRNLGEALRAVKEMIQSPMDDAQHEKAIGDFKRESLLLTSLEHPSIPTIYDYFYDDNEERFYLVMKYISGGDLLTRLRSSIDGKIDEKTVTEWGVQIADVLDYLHNRRPPIIYRDLKPANLMIDGNSGRIMLIDFGIARWVAPQEKGVTAVGTMGYAPPELFSGKVEPRSDIYSLGATLFHLATGVDPQDNPLLIFDFNKNPRPGQLNPNISKEMEQIIMRSVECTPEDRFVSAAEMRDALSQHLNRLTNGEVGKSPNIKKTDPTSTIETVFCGFCGGRIAATDIFCAYCGSRQPQVNASAALHHRPRTTAKLVVAGTTKLDASFLLEKESHLVGRTDPHSNIFPEIDLSKYDPNTKVSRRHARIWREGENFLVEDLGSVNGTVVNDAVRLAPRQPRVLESGDKLRLGETTLHFLVS